MRLHAYTKRVVLLCAVVAGIGNFICVGSTAVRAAVFIVREGDTLDSAVGGSSNVGNALGNVLLMQGGVVKGTVYGGSAMGSGGAAGNAGGNTVVVSGGVVQGSVYGGYSQQGDASGNSVIVRGGQVDEDVLGGRAPRGNVTHNTVTIVGSPRFGDKTGIAGGVGGAGQDEITGNTLNSWGTRVRVMGVGGFQTYNFTLPAYTAHGDVLYTFTGPAPANVNNTTVRILRVEGPQPLFKGNVVTLLSKAEGSPALVQATNVRQGLARLYDFDVAVTDGALTATVSREARTNPESAPVTKPPSVSVGMTGQASDLAAGDGMQSAWRAAAAASLMEGRLGTSPRRAAESVLETGPEQCTDMQDTACEPRPGEGQDALQGGWGLRPFAALSGGFLRYQVGERVNVWSASLMTGLSKRWDAGPLALTTALFFEGGRGRYDSSEKADTGVIVRGRGELDYDGGGVLARLDVTQGLLRGLHVEGSARTGSTGSTFRSHDLGVAGLREADFSLRTPYTGLHGGLGWLWQWGDTGLDLYARYHWTRLQPGSATVLDEPLRYDATHSGRWQGGARLTHDFGPGLAAYVGAMYEYECDGRVGGRISGMPLPASSLRGDTGMGEAGLVWRPGRSESSSGSRTSALSGFTVEAGVQAFTGQREGWLGRLQIAYEF